MRFIDVIDYLKMIFVVAWYFLRLMFYIEREENVIVITHDKLIDLERPKFSRKIGRITIEAE